MSETGSDRPINVTAQERPHPALRKLARACIALARQLRDAAAPSPPAAETGSGDPSREQRHG
jgi:hypothetical protein